ncbi:hypothetical protein D3C71_1276430 [compost metagenome]
MQEQGVADTQQHRPRAQPLADHRISAVQLRIAATEQLCAAQVLGIDVTQVVVQHHRLVIAEDEMHRAAGLGCLLLQAVQQPECLGDLRATVEHIAGDHQRVAAQRPLVLRIDHLVGAQQGAQQLVLTMDVGHRNDARHRRQRGYRYGGWRLQGQCMRIATFGRQHGGRIDQLARIDLVIADPARQQRIAIAEHIRAIGVDMFGGRGDFLGRRCQRQRGQGAERNGTQQWEAMHRNRVLGRWTKRGHGACSGRGRCPSALRHVA